MNKNLTLSQMSARFPTNNACLEEIKKLRYPQGIFCTMCDGITKHYKLEKRLAYACEFCREQVYPLKGTLFEKSTTPLRLWFFVMFLMVCTRGKISAKTVQDEIGVTYKTSWRMRQSIMRLMKQNHADLLKEPESTLSVSFFNAFELKVVQKQATS